MRTMQVTDDPNRVRDSTYAELWENVWRYPGMWITFSYYDGTHNTFETLAIYENGNAIFYPNYDNSKGRKVTENDIGVGSNIKIGDIIIPPGPRIKIKLSNEQIKNIRTIIDESKIENSIVTIEKIPESQSNIEAMDNSRVEIIIKVNNPKASNPYLREFTITPYVKEDAPEYLKPLIKELQTIMDMQK